MTQQSMTRLYRLYLERSPYRRTANNKYGLIPEAGDGTIWRYTTYGGVELVCSQLQYHEPYPTFFTSPIPLIELQFAISGERHVAVDRTEYALPVGQGALIFLHQFKAHFYPPYGEPYHSFAVGIPVPLFHHAVSRLPARGISRFQHILNGASFRALTFEIDPRCALMIEELTASLQDELRSPLAIEAAVLELVDRCLEQLFGGYGIPEGLSREDVRKLQLAKSILESQMAEPPSLLDLSRLIGLNDYKLKRGFKQCFGTTVFGYLRDIRMDHAMRMLQNRRLSVTDTALLVGYSNISAFSQQFFRQHGIMPSEVKKQH